MPIHTRTSGGPFLPSDLDLMRGTSVKRTSNLTTPFDYYDSGETGFTNNGVIEFDTVEYDDDSLWDVGDPTKIGPVPSSYNGKRAVFYGNVIWQDDTTYAELKIFRNSNLLEPIWVAQIASVASFNTAPNFATRPIVLATGDYFELCARSGDSATALYAEDYSLTFAVEVRGV